MSTALIGPKFYGFDKDGVKLSFGLLYTYEAGTNTKKTTYQDEAHTIENTNPIRLNAQGYADVYLSGTYNLVLQTSNQVKVWESDNVKSNFAIEWNFNKAVTYISSTSFSVVGSAEVDYSIGRKVRLKNDVDQYAYSTVKSAAYNGTITTITLVDPVVQVSTVEISASIIGIESQQRIGSLTDYYFNTVEDAQAGISISGEQVIFKAGDIINITERGNYLFDVVTGIAGVNTYNIIACNQPDLSFVLRLEKTMSLGAFGVIGVDDPLLIFHAANLDSVKTLLLPDITIDRSINIQSDIHFKPESGSTVTVTTSFNGRMFTGQGSNLTIDGFIVSGNITLVYQSVSFNEIKISNCVMVGDADEQAQFLFETVNEITGNLTKLTGNTLTNTAIANMDDCECKVVRIHDNTCETPPAYFFSGVADLYAARIKQLFISSNIVTDISGTQVSKSGESVFARVETENGAWLNNNVFNGAESTTKAGLIICRYGSLFVNGNTIKNIKGVRTHSIIQDEGTIAVRNQAWMIFGNTFDQTNVLEANSPEAGVRVKEANNVTVKHNKFIGLKCFATSFHHLGVNTNYPDGCTFNNNEIHDHDYPVVVKAHGSIKGVSIKNNDVFYLINSLNTESNGYANCRLAELALTVSNTVDLEKISIANNTVYESTTTFSFASFYFIDTNINHQIDNVSIIGNEAKAGSIGFIGYFESDGIGTGFPAGTFDFINNVGAAGMTIGSAEAPTLRSSGNVIT